MKCEGCNNELDSRYTKDVKTGYCYECRRKAFGFNIPPKKPYHTEMKDRKTCNVVGASAADFNTNT
jgi:hypothetical protein